MQRKISNWWLVRHAPVPLKTLYGQQDVEAEYTDHTAFRWLANELPLEARWITSDLSRCVKTAGRILEAANNEHVKLQTCRDLREQNFGDWQGSTYAEIEQTDPETYMSFWENPAKNTPPGGESFEDLVARVCPVPLAYQQEKQCADTVIVAHAGTIRALVANALDLSVNAALRLEIAPLSLTKLTLYEADGGEHWQVSWTNRISNG
ncbi:MAG: histidine phosphatase family protein [Sneathiella sp.]